MPNTRSKQLKTRKPVQKRTTKLPLGKKTADEEAFTRSLIVHGQAAKPQADGTLPSGATHELIEDEKGSVRPVRRRFSVL